MTTVIIGGGEKARAAIQELETASLTMSDNERSIAEYLLKHFVREAELLCKMGC